MAMLLAEFRPTALLEALTCFSFGEHYRADFQNGFSIEFKDLDAALECIRDEFLAAGKVPFLWVGKHRIRMGSLLTVKVTTNRFAGTPSEIKFLVDMKIEQIRAAVTMYSLTQSWAGITVENA